MKSAKNLAVAEKTPLLKNADTLVQQYPSVPLTVDCVIFGFEENKLKVLLIRSDLDG
jgi:8-oxo-dGTP diphosphatase